MNFILSPDYTVFDIEDKFDELAEYVNTITKSGYSIDRNREILIDFYKLYKNAFGKSVKTYLLAVSNTITSSMYYDLKGDTLSQVQNKNFTKMMSNFNEVEKTIQKYNLFSHATSMVKTIYNTQGKFIYLGNSTDDLDLNKALTINDMFGKSLFDGVYNMTENNEETLETILEVEDLDRTDTALITADLAQAHAAGILDLEVLFVNRDRINTTSMDKSIVNFRGLDIKTFENNKKVTDYLYQNSYKSALA